MESVVWELKLVFALLPVIVDILAESKVVMNGALLLLQQHSERLIENEEK